jgi:hypothetical protein
MTEATLWRSRKRVNSVDPASVNSRVKNGRPALTVE